jgi:2-haloacid dehalogenase
LSEAFMPMPAAFVFDAYGTLFDVHGFHPLAEALAPGQGAALLQHWRTRQLEYSWQCALMASSAYPRPDFLALTQAALDYAIAALMVPIDDAGRRTLVDAYLALPPYPDALTTLAALAPRPRVILSNGTRGMLDPLVATAGMAPLLDAVLSVDAADTYKPAPAVYRLAADHLGLAPADIGFVSANGWDAAGAKAAGFTTFWINRLGAPAERHAPPPDYSIGSLADLARIVTA